MTTEERKEALKAGGELAIVARLLNAADFCHADGDAAALREVAKRMTDVEANLTALSTLSPGDVIEVEGARWNVVEVEWLDGPYLERDGQAGPVGYWYLETLLRAAAHSPTFKIVRGGERS